MKHPPKYPTAPPGTHARMHLLKARDILMAFVEDMSRGSTTEHNQNHRPPWREKKPNGRLGPWFGPTTAGAMKKRLDEYHERAGGEAMWDRSEDGRVMKREAQKAAERYDAEPMRRYVEIHSHEIPEQELEVYFAFYRDGLTRTECASKMGITRNTFDGYLLTLRRRMKGIRKGVAPKTT